MCHHCSVNLVNRNISWVSSARFAPFLAACEEDEKLAWELYEWNARVASALSECFHHAEVLLRNTMMRELERVHPLAYPWQTELASIPAAAQKRRDETTRTASPDSIISELTLGFWTHLLSKSNANDELWRQHLRRAFPGSSGVRETVFKAVTDMRNLRNRCAHQDSLLDYSPGIELKKLLSLVEWIDPDARKWIESVESVTAVDRERPVPFPRNVVIVGARADEAIAMYKAVHAYVCPSDRSFAPVEYLGFYSDQKIEGYFPRVLDTVVPSRWNREEAERLKSSPDATDQHLAKVLGYGLKNGWDAGGQYQVFLLSKLNASETLRRAEDAAIPHLKRGRGSAFVQNKRYLSHSALLAADNTNHLT